MPTLSVILSRMRPLQGLAMAFAGAMLITPDTLLIRLSGLEGWGLTFWRGLLIGCSVFVLWLLLEGRAAIRQFPPLFSWPAIILVVAILKCLFDGLCVDRLLSHGGGLSRLYGLRHIHQG